MVAHDRAGEAATAWFSKGSRVGVPACVTTIRRLRKDPRVPRSAKVAIAIAGLWVLSPIDLIPEFLPVIGPLDDIVVVALAFRFASATSAARGDL